MAGWEGVTLDIGWILKHALSKSMLLECTVGLLAATLTLVTMDTFIDYVLLNVASYIFVLIN